MNKFGYNIKKDQQIDYDNLNRSMAALIANLEPSFNICIQCGSCSASCTAANYTNFSFRKLCLLIHRGIIEDVQKEISKCMLCGKCRLVCPRGVNTRNIILNVHLALKNKQLHEI